MGRPLDKHIDEQELEALASSYASEDQGGEIHRPASVSEVERHLASCADCGRKVSQYREVVSRLNAGVSPAGMRRADCPSDIDWHDVAAGLWPELRTRQLITHAARCEHCGPLLRAALASDEPTAHEEEFLAQLKAPRRPAMQATKKFSPSNRSLSLRIWRRWMDWKVLVPAGALLVLVAALSASRLSSSAPLAGVELAQFAANTHEQHLRGALALEVQTSSQARVNEWLHKRPEFALVLPASSEVPSEQLPFRIQGAGLIGLGNKTAAYIAYQMPSDPVSLIVTPVSVAVASGGIEVAFKKVTFHYYTVHGYKVVTWSVHGLTYALVSQEGSKTQRSCMVCHSAMRDRDLSQTPTPLPDQKKTAEPVWQ